MKLSLLSICLGTSQAFFISMSPVYKGTLLTASVPIKEFDPRRCKEIHSPRMQNDDEIYEAEEAVIGESQHVSDSGVESAVMERAVMMADDMMKKKKLELKEKVGDARAAEQQYVMMEQAARDLMTQYKEDPSTFKGTHVRNLNGYEVAVEMLESVIADASQKMVDVENSQKLVITQFYDLLEQEDMAEERAANESLAEEEANERVAFIEEFADPYEVEERRRDMAVSHAAHETAESEHNMAKEIAAKKLAVKDKEQKLQRQLADYKRHGEMLKEDLRMIQEIVREKLVDEWQEQIALKGQEEKMM